MTVRDPVCGRHLTIDQVTASADHGGWEYFFCSADCHGRFLRAPAAIADAAPARATARQSEPRQDA